MSFIRFLLDHGYATDLDVRDSCGLTPLYYALEGNCHSEAIPFLLENGVDVNVGFDHNDGCTSLHAACYAMKYDEAIKLIESGALVNAIWQPKGPVAISILCYDGLMPFVRPIEICLMNWRNLVWGTIGAHCREDLERRCQPILNLVRRLIHVGADLNVCPGSRVSPADIAASLQSVHFLELLREAGVHFKHAGYAIQAAIWQKGSKPSLRPDYYNPHPVVKWLLLHRAPISNENDLFDAILMGASLLLDSVTRLRAGELLHCLLQHGMDPNLSNATGLTIFKHFFQQHDLSYCSKLIEYGGNPGDVVELFQYIITTSVSCQAYANVWDKHIPLEDKEHARVWREKGASEDSLRFLLEIDRGHELIGESAIEEAISVGAHGLVKILLDARQAQICDNVRYPAAL